VTFGFTLTAGDSPINRLDVDFGDGNRRSLAVSGNTSVAHVYGAPGLYTVQARVGDTSGQSNYATAVINVTAPLTTGTR
jgi:PKD repeat protein